MKNLSQEFIAKEEANQRKPIELYRFWFTDRLNQLEWYYTSNDEIIYHDNHIIRREELDLTISSESLETWKIYSIPVILPYLVTSLYIKYLSAVEPDWETNQDHIDGQVYWINEVITNSIAFENLEEAFRDGVNIAWDSMYPGETNPWLDEYDPATGIVVTEELIYEESKPFIIGLVISLYNKYIGDVEPEWYNNANHVKGQNYWIEQVETGVIDFNDLELYFRSSLNERWEGMYGEDVINPWTGVYDPATGIVATDSYDATLDLFGFIEINNNTKIPILSVLDKGAGVLVLKSSFSENDALVEETTVSTGSVFVLYPIYYLPATINRGTVSYNSELDVQTLKIEVPYINEIALKYIAVNPVSMMWISVKKLHRTDAALLNISEYRLFFIQELYKKYVEPHDPEWEENQDHIDGIIYWSKNSTLIEDLEETFYTTLVLDWSETYPEIANPYTGVPYNPETGIPTSTEADVLFLGQIKDTSFKGLGASINCVGFSHFLKMTIPVWRYQLTCNHRLFDECCTLDRDSYVFSGEVTVDGAIITSSVLGTVGSGYFVGGEITYGAESRKIVSHAGNSITVAYVFTTLKNGNLARFYPGCDGRIETCRDTFDNILNYLGFPFIPLEKDNPAIRTSLGPGGASASGGGGLDAPYITRDEYEEGWEGGGGIGWGGGP